MQPSWGMICIFLLVRLQWSKSYAEGRKINETNNGDISVTDSNQSTVRLTSERVLPMPTATNSSTVSHTSPTTANAKQNVTSSWPRSMSLRSTNGTTSTSNATTVSKDGINNSATNFNRIPTSLATFTTTGDFSGVTKSATDISASTATPSNSTVTSSNPLATEYPSSNSSIDSTVFPTGITLTSPTVKQDSSTLSIQETTELSHNFSSHPTTSSNSEDDNEDETNKGVVVGVIVGAILGSLLVGLIGYFICGKKRSESFSHRRLYDDTRNDPVLHLDNSLGPFDTTLGCVSDDKSSPADNTECASDGIPMADMTPSHPSP
ncbi:mucin-15 [Colius striatus]|uniref:mucin-15 n=1 Tax=Colius striatus TaxID=57412 RepID=UPI002B1DC1CE|nr:mucin-15 [Colius striatus]XP_061855064.1 mucin-15 [Colius striatus]XP_061855065.1 mucin-15 [Colius striatus]